MGNRVSGVSAGKKRRSKKPKVLVPKIDGLGPHDTKRILTALRKIWGWNYGRKLVIDRCTDGEGFGRCEKCKKRCPKIFVDHIRPVGTFHPRETILKMFVSSKQLQGLCKICHQKKTNVENAKTRRKKKDIFEGFSI